MVGVDGWVADFWHHGPCVDVEVVHQWQQIGVEREILSKRKEERERNRSDGKGEEKRENEYKGINVFYQVTVGMGNRILFSLNRAKTS